MNGINGHTRVDYDALVIGTGFSGIRMLYELKKLGISAKAFETGSGVGGTWYWNRYPGARTDISSWTYIFTALEELGVQPKNQERFPSQSAVEEYLNSITDHLGLRENIEFNTRVAAARHDKASNTWTVKTSTGQEYKCTYLITATGPLATPLAPPFPGLESYKGEWYHTGSWPKHRVDFTGKRVAVVGVGASAVQVIPIVAHTARSLTVFQRTPSYVIPARNYTLTQDEKLELRRGSAARRDQIRAHNFGLDLPVLTRTIADVKDKAEVQRILEYSWEIGGFSLIFETFADLLFNPDANEAVAEFIRSKIRTVVKDEKTANLLCPDSVFFAKRPPLGHHFYETFNRDNVELVDIRDNPIEEITSSGLRTGTTGYDFDIIIFAIGFDAVTGTLNRIDIRNSGNQALADQMNVKRSTAYGITVPNFPNLFTIVGPLTAFGNLPIVIEEVANYVGKMIVYMREHGHSLIHTSESTADEWLDQTNAAMAMTCLGQSAERTRSWYIGANVEGKEVGPLFYLGGTTRYFAQLEKEAAEGYPGYKFSRSVLGA